MLSKSGKQKKARFWPQLRRLLIFQLKLYIDAFRDFFLSLLSMAAFVLDVVLQSHGEGSWFESVLKFGRRTEKTINLFEQYGEDEQSGPSVDSVINDVENRFRRDSDDK